MPNEIGFAIEREVHPATGDACPTAGTHHTAVVADHRPAGRPPARVLIRFSLRLLLLFQEGLVLLEVFHEIADFA